MQARAGSSRRSKVTVRWLPVELIIEIFRRVQKLIGRKDFKLDCWKSMRLERQYYKNLLVFALSSKEWTAIAQAELFRDIILKDRSKLEQFLRLVRENAELRMHAESSLAIRFGGVEPGLFDMTGLDGELDEIALHCPNVVEISCYRVDARLEYFRNMKNLEKLNIMGGSILPPSTSRAPSPPFTLSITLLFLFKVDVPSLIDPSSLPLVKSLHLYFQACQPLQQLLPQLDSLNTQAVINRADLGVLIQESTSITFLSLCESDIAKLDDASKTVIKERIMELSVRTLSYADADSTLAAILDGSKAMKKVILDGDSLSLEDQVAAKFHATLKVVKETCKKKDIELWKANFEVGNGKVDLEK